MDYKEWEMIFPFFFFYKGDIDMVVIFLIIITNLYISLIFGIIVMIKDIKKRIKNNKIANENKRKIKMICVSLIIIALIIMCLVICHYVLFFKIV